jgi:putative chitinase
MKLNEADFKAWDASNSYLYIDWMNKYCEEFEVNTTDRLLCFIPNLLHESNNFRSVREILPKNNPAYVARLGKYSGKGLIQLTWLANYQTFTDFCKKTYPGFKHDFVKNPELVETPQFAVLSAFWFWKANNLNAWADKDDFRNVCSIINTGRVQDPKKPHTINGWEDRLKKYTIVENWIKNLING